MVVAVRDALVARMHQLMVTPSQCVSNRTDYLVYCMDFGERWRVTSMAWKRPLNDKEVWWR